MSKRDLFDDFRCTGGYIWTYLRVQFSRVYREIRFGGFRSVNAKSKLPRQVHGFKKFEYNHLFVGSNQGIDWQTAVALWQSMTARMSKLELQKFQFSGAESSLNQDSL